MTAIYSVTTVRSIVAAFMLRDLLAGYEAAVQRAADELCIDVQAVREAIDAKDTEAA